MSRSGSTWIDKLKLKCESTARARHERKYDIRADTAVLSNVIQPMFSDKFMKLLYMYSDIWVGVDLLNLR